MKKICFLLLFCFLIGCDSGVLTEKDDGKELHFNVGQEFVLELPENPTTGYRWKIETDPDPQLVIQQISDTFQSQNTKLIGGGGKRSIRFRISNQGSVKLQAFHERPWEVYQKRFEPNLNVTIIGE